MASHMPLALAGLLIVVGAQPVAQRLRAGDLDVLEDRHSGRLESGAELLELDLQDLTAYRTAMTAALVYEVAVFALALLLVPLLPKTRVVDPDAVAVGSRR